MESKTSVGQKGQLDLTGSDWAEACILHMLPLQSDSCNASEMIPRIQNTKNIFPAPGDNKETNNSKQEQMILFI